MMELPLCQRALEAPETEAPSPRSPRTGRSWRGRVASCHRTPLRALAVVSLLGLAAPPTRCFAQSGGKSEQAPDPSVEASERFQRGVKLYKALDFEAALVEFKRAYELDPNYRVLYNLGQTSRELKDYAAALVAYERYLEEGGAQIQGPRRKEVEKALEELRQRVGTVTFSIDVEGAEVFIDDVAIGVSPIQRALTVNVGQRIFSATKMGHAPARRAIEIAGRDSVEIKLELPNLATEAPPGDPLPPPPPPPPVPERDPPVAALVALGLTGATGVVAAVLGGLTLGAQADLDEALDTFPGDPEGIDEARGRTRSMAIATDVMLGVTAAGAVSSVILFVLHATSGPEAEPSPEAVPDVSLAPLPGGAFVGVSSRF
jgi:tetratricopeptide (TPR) repeat protein